MTMYKADTATQARTTSLVIVGTLVLILLVHAAVGLPALGAMMLLSVVAIAISSALLVAGIENARLRAQRVSSERKVFHEAKVLRIGVTLPYMTSHVVRLLNGRRTRSGERIIAERVTGGESSHDIRIVDSASFLPRDALRTHRTIVISGNSKDREVLAQRYGDSIGVVKNFDDLLSTFNIDPRTPTAMTQNVIWAWDICFAWATPFVGAVGVLAIAALIWAFVAHLI